MSRERFSEAAEALGLVVEGIGIAAIGISVAVALSIFFRRWFQADGRDRAYRDTRRCLGRGVLLGLELLVAGDIIRTVAVTPSFTSIGVLRSSC